jgi:hypothetical protein
MFASLIVALTIIFNKKLKGHPNMLIAYLAIANLGSCWSVLIWAVKTNDVTCYFGWAQTFHKAVWLLNRNFTVEDSIIVLNRANMIAYEMFQMIAVCMNAFMCIDLYFSYKNPFFPGKYRMKYYLGGTLFILLTIGLFTKSWLLSPDQEFYQFVLPFFYKSPYY